MNDYYIAKRFAQKNLENLQDIIYPVVILLYLHEVKLDVKYYGGEVNYTNKEGFLCCSEFSVTLEKNEPTKFTLHL